MTITARRPAPLLAAQPDTDRVARVTGLLFLVTYVTSIPAAFYFYTPVTDHPGYLLGAGADQRVLWGAFLEVILVLANIGTAVTLFPVLKRQHEGLALGFVTARVMESVFISVGILSVLTLVSLRQDASGAGDVDSAALATVGDALVTLKQWTFDLGPGFIVGVGNGVILGCLLYRSGLVPRGMAVLGLVGGPLVCLSGAAVVLGVIESGSSWQLVASVPEFFWELSLGVYLLVKGFRPAPILAAS